MEKFTSGELGDSILTLRDLELIRKSFVHILEGYFHTRIEYPRLAQLGAGRDRRRRGRKADGAVGHGGQDSAVEIAVDGVPVPPLAARAARGSAQSGPAAAGFDAWEMSLLLCGDERIAELNGATAARTGPPTFFRFPRG